MNRTMALAAVVCVVGCGDVEVRGGNKTPPAASGGAPRLVSDPAELSSRSRILYRPGAPRASKADELPGIVGTLPTIEPEPEPSPSPSPEPECRTDDDCGMGGGCGCVQDDLGDWTWTCTTYTGRCVKSGICESVTGSTFCLHGEWCIPEATDQVALAGCVQCTNVLQCDDNNPCTQDSCGMLGVCYHETDFWENLPCNGDGSTCEEGVCTEPDCSMQDVCIEEHRRCAVQTCIQESPEGHCLIRSSYERYHACGCEACPASLEDLCDSTICVSQPERTVPEFPLTVYASQGSVIAHRIKLVSGRNGVTVSGMEIFAADIWGFTGYNNTLVSILGNNGQSGMYLRAHRNYQEEQNRQQPYLWVMDFDWPVIMPPNSVVWLEITYPINEYVDAEWVLTRDPVFQSVVQAVRYKVTESSPMLNVNCTPEQADECSMRSGEFTVVWPPVRCVIPMNYTLYDREDSIIGGGAVGAHMGCCNEDSDCVGSEFGAYCVPSFQMDDEPYTGMCQPCLQDQQNTGCRRGQSCRWGAETLIDISQEVEEHGSVRGAPMRSVYWCE